jgi:hypothetical protein
MASNMTLLLLFLLGGCLVFVFARTTIDLKTGKKTVDGWPVYDHKGPPYTIYSFDTLLLILAAVVIYWCCFTGGRNRNNY